MAALHVSTGSFLLRAGVVALVVLAAAKISPAAQLINLSSRAVAYPGGDAMTAGFVIAGPAQKTVLIRAAGPALGAFGVSGTLSAPQLELSKTACGSA